MALSGAEVGSLRDRSFERLSRGWGLVAPWLRHPQAPIAVLGLVLVCSLVSRTLHIGDPCSNPCASHTLIFDEAYYVDAARVIDGIHPPAGDPYRTAPLGVDPNAEHPELAKLIVAGTIDLFGNDPWGWRLGSVMFGTVALLAMFALVQGLGGGPWLAVGATAVMAADNLFLVHGRIATLDIYALAMMLAAAALYVRRRPFLAGVLAGIAACMKETALVVLLAFLLYELILDSRRSRRTWTRLASCWATAVASFVALLAVLEQVVAAYNPATHVRYQSPFTEIAHILAYGKALTVLPHATGISSSPWQWLVDQKPIPYAKVAENVLSGGHVLTSHILILFQGEVNPFIMFIAIPALVIAVRGAWQGDRLDAFAVAWFLATFLPYVFLNTVEHRITYLYYVLSVMPAIYLAGARLFARLGPAAIGGWGIALLAGLVDLYPIRSF